MAAFRVARSYLGLLPLMIEIVGRISVRECADRLGRGEPMALLDVRENWEREWASIPAPPDVVDLHVPMGTVTTRLDAIRKSSDGRSLVVYCHHGVRSRMVAEWLAGQGVASVWNLEGGIEAWSVEVDGSVKRY
jgi:rhodanese-related sulfurtransferase